MANYFFRYYKYTTDDLLYARVKNGIFKHLKGHSLRVHTPFGILRSRIQVVELEQAISDNKEEVSNILYQ
mgnify:CR=1 FL=1